MKRKSFLLTVVFASFFTIAGAVAQQKVKTKQQPPTGGSKTAKTKAVDGKAKTKKSTGKFPSPSDSKKYKLKQLFKGAKLWIDQQRKIVVIEGQVVLRGGPLEMFACPKGTKEHESVVALECQGFHVHAGLLAVGAKSGSPVSFRPKYKQASGTPVDILVLWVDKNGKKRRINAKEWVYNIDSKKELDKTWVFAGSKFWTDPKTKRRYYQGDSGDLICVSNFPTATLDLPIKSTQANEGLLFHANTKKIPALGTKVRLVLVPRLKK